MLCWVSMPTGCAKALTETQTPQQWFVDTGAGSHDAGRCNSRLGDFNRHCGRNDGRTHWGNKPDVGPKLVELKRQTTKLSGHVQKRSHIMMSVDSEGVVDQV